MSIIACRVYRLQCRIEKSENVVVSTLYTLSTADSTFVHLGPYNSESRRVNVRLFTFVQHEDNMACHCPIKYRAYSMFTLTGDMRAVVFFTRYD